MQILLVVDRTESWPLRLEGVRVVSSREYISSLEFSGMRKVRVYNLSSSYSYQTVGYYVSLLAEARGHKPVPDIPTICDMKSQTIVRFISEDLDSHIQRDLAHIKGDRFILSVYFGRNVAKHYDKLSAKLFSIIKAPFMRAHFSRQKNRWVLQSLTPIAAKEIPEDHLPFIMDRARQYFSDRKRERRKRGESRYDLAILYDPAERRPPSNERAIRKFVRAARAVGFDVSLIQKEDYVRLAEFDALFIRETTAVNHHTFRFAQRAAAEGLVVIDDPESILKCTNKVFLAELLKRHRIPAPRTVVLGRGNIAEVAAVGFPCILKKPDSSFSEGVIKVSNETELKAAAKAMLRESELIIAQEYTPTDFDWRIGILDRKVIYVCRYYMAPGHWQIINNKVKGKPGEGLADCLPLASVPEKVTKTALKAANLIGNGFYGVDLKQAGEKVYVIEVNDNPSIDAGCEDAILKESLYLSVMETILGRIESKKRGKAA